jgi:HUS1 checkpoint protein
MMPPLKLLRNVIDRMKNIHDYFIITANMAGELTLKVETDMVSVATFYTNLDHPQIGTAAPAGALCVLFHALPHRFRVRTNANTEGRSPPRRDQDKTAEVKVDIKKFNRFLYSYQVSPTNVILCIIENTALVLHVLLEVRSVSTRSFSPTTFVAIS